MLEQVADFISLCSSATADEIETAKPRCQPPSCIITALTLLEYGADPYDAIKFAIEEKNREATAVILKTFPDVLNELYKRESFVTFCRVAPYAMIEAKLKDGAFPNGRCPGSVVPLHAAAEDNPDPSVLKLLTDYGAEPNAAAVLHHASVSGNIVLINALLKSGVKVDSRTKLGITALMAASRTAYYLCCNRNDDYPEKLAVEGIKALLKAGADVNIQGLDGETALISAAFSRNPAPEIIIALLNAGAKTHFKDSKGKRAIDYARQAESLAGTEGVFTSCKGKPVIIFLRVIYTVNDFPF